jgi:glutathione S-transferase
MTLTLHYHPLSSYCHKVLIALYENGADFERVIIDFGDQASADAFRALWPLARMPVLVDGARKVTVGESTIVIDHLDAFHPGPVRFTPEDPDHARRVRFWDRFFDLYVHTPVQRIVGDALRPPQHRDGFGVDQAHAQLRDAYMHVEREMDGHSWMGGESFSLADCAAEPALFYANTIEPIGAEFPLTRAYLRRLMARSSVRRVLEEAAPWFHLYPLTPKPTLDPPAC